mmetsp:Transcript_103220/g.328314  ORF Transcript_103220/g.328314 Transcript_103220/m.328314 type:complete len:219 (-) Transcript_103220:156-812(-)
MPQTSTMAVSTSVANWASSTVVVSPLAGGASSSGTSSASFSPKVASTGVSAMATTTTPRRSLTVKAGNTMSLPARVNMTKANSPPPARMRPSRTPCLGFRPKSGEHAATTAALTARRLKRRKSVTGHSCKRMPGSTCAPVVRKKRPSKRPRRGMTSASICVRKLDSASSVPARKAPRVVDSPKTSVSLDMPRMTRIVRATNVSADLVPAMTLYTCLTT